MYFILIVAICYLYLKYRDVSKDLENINNHLEGIENIVDNLKENGDVNEKVTFE